MTLAPWQQEQFERSMTALADGRLGHAQLLIGPGSLGTLGTAEAIGKRLLCTQATGMQHACGRCKSCLLLQAGSHPDWHYVTFGFNKEGKLRTEIVVDQLRELGDRLELSSQLGGAIIAVIQPADAMNDNATNALLKTLEEPMPGRYIFLVASQASSILPTIRSRCQRMEFRMPGIGEALHWLQEQGIDATTAQAALRAARGNPGLALEWIRDGKTLPLRADVIAALDALHEGTEDIRTLATKWAKHDRLRQILEFAADHALDRMQRLASDVPPAQSLALGDWFDRANQSRRWLATTLRQDLMLMELLTRWQALKI